MSTPQIPTTQIPSTVPARLFDTARRYPDAVAYRVKVGGEWKPTTYAAYAAEVRQAARALVSLGLQPGGTVCILGFNRPEWVVCDVAAMVVGGAPAGIYTTNSPTEVQYIVHHAEASIVLLENAMQWEKVNKVRGELPHLKHVVMMKGAVIDDPMVLTWEQFLARADETPDAEVERRLLALKEKDLATLIYTSGTTGPPKAVMLSHENLAWTAKTAIDLVKIGPDDCSLSYLPLSHIAEQMFSIHAPITCGSSISFAESMEKVPENLREVLPTVLFAVPRIWEKFHAGVSAKLSLATGMKKKLVAWAMSVGQRYHTAKGLGQDPGAFLSFQHTLADKLIYSKVKPVLGLTRARVCVSGAAPVSKEVLTFLAGIDVLVHEVYGQSEGSGPTTFNVPGKTKLGSVGPAIPGAEVKLAADGEILLRGPNVFLGYYRDAAATAETLVDGWLLSGDLGAFDADGFLSIVGRKKEILITAGGKNVAPKNIEAALKNHPLIGEAVVIGDRRAYLTALLQVDLEALARFGELSGLGATVGAEDPKVREELQKAVDACNELFARVEHVRKYKVLPRPLAIDTGELTPTLKLKRKNIYTNFAKEIEEMYEGGAS
ncbi:MAG: long-chain fatty acid--CoA ligase [Pseudomonadota bacterium]|nr:long-chain fatty acid--CoA ligase [Pseudomonadota bacterium]